MSYEPTNWKTGDIITAQKLNKIENAIGPIYLASQQTTDIATLMFNDETSVNYETIIEGINAGRQFNLRIGSAENFGILPLSRCYQQEAQTDGGTEYHVVFVNGTSVVNYFSQSPTEALTCPFMAPQPLPYTPGEGGSGNQM